MNINVINLKKLDYGIVLNIQEKLLAARQKDEIEDTLLLVEHPSTLTLGVRGKFSNILVTSAVLKNKNIDIYEVNRGGDVTYHGPGQIVGYPIINLSNYGRDIKKFIWNIEEVFIRLLQKEFDIIAQREDKKYTGVWIGDKKITAIGIAVKHWVTMHGFAFNVNTNLEHFNLINPCGLIDKGVTSLQELTGAKQDFNLLNQLVIDYFCEVFELQKKIKDIKDLGI
ncbi:MAG TPA: lipoyl(octanoyl) transferase LipB [Clostridia bacterium]|nr:lipoyl(octanoyl) transferase LipB [Clostridia bacterium]